ncbi:hypothetical protein MES4922_260098 [Mesorhizobium ventifaucium]|uniref:Uncharacterized protein n=1 Tax=Mesorhizobium ventifaucium TaxID=666020 RepID=A0ABM9DXD0_9HYPH|nr:hypothetical protein MES4922_260098 [Mesorhizobium ventifaucium]
MDLQFETGQTGSNEGKVSTTVSRAAVADEVAQQHWLRDTSNKLVTPFVH